VQRTTQAQQRLYLWQLKFTAPSVVTMVAAHMRMPAGHCSME
jgi:hypothetical protein